MRFDIRLYCRKQETRLVVKTLKVISRASPRRSNNTPLEHPRTVIPKAAKRQRPRQNPAEAPSSHGECGRKMGRSAALALWRITESRFRRSRKVRPERSAFA